MKDRKNSNEEQNTRISRRDFMSGAATAVATFTIVPRSVLGGSRHIAPSEKLNIAGIGVGGRGSGDLQGVESQNIVALCDVDFKKAAGSFRRYPNAKKYKDFRRMLDKEDKNIDAVVVATPDHIHAVASMAAIKRSKHVYCEKPLTHSVYEARVLAKAAREYKVATQMGNQGQASEETRLMCEYIWAGAIGPVREVHVWTDRPLRGINDVYWPQGVDRPKGEEDVPPTLDWDLWLGPAPLVPYVPERCHYTFRWWYEYAGGKVTDWGAHDIDIAQWGIDQNPVEVSATGKLPDIPNGYNVSTGFEGIVRYPGGVELVVTEKGRAGTLFEGDKGRIFVNRGTISGTPVEQLKEDPLPPEKFQLYDYDNVYRPQRVGKLDAIVNHMGNFFDCVRARKTPISDLESQHRSATTCHLVNLSIRLGRSLSWDAEKEEIVGDAEANTWLSREQRKGYEVT